MNEWFTLLLSAFVSVVVAYITAKASSYSKDVVAERQKWRERIRKLTVELVKIIHAKKTHSEEYQTFLSELRLRLNPDDSYDQDILEAFEKCKKHPDEVSPQKILVMAARLLKHDWERAKYESRTFGFMEPDKWSIRRLKPNER